MKILVVNSGSSSLKFQLFEKETLAVSASGVIEKIGEQKGLMKLEYRDSDGVEQDLESRFCIDDHGRAIELMEQMFQETAVLVDLHELAAVGHRVVHGGETFHKPVLVTSEVLDTIKDFIPLAPLHNPANIAGIEAFMVKAPNVPQIAVFDTAFHQTIPEHAFLYALPYRLYENHKVRRYGFHGTSHAYVSREAARFLGRPYDELKIISLHLGNGASAAAIDCGNCVDTSMGLTPLEGLVMGTRSGDIDPAILFYLAREAGMDMSSLDLLLNTESGLKGICGNNDMRSVGELASAGDSRAQLALDIFCYRIKKYVGSYLAVLGGADCIIFTGGIGENDTAAREQALEGLDRLGIRIDPVKNREQESGITAIDAEGSSCRVLVVPTDEEFEIATQTLAFL